MTEPLLRIESLAGGYGATRILHGVDLSVGSDGVTALLGANGAGKTTLMKTLAGVLPASSGRIFFRGEEITGRNAAERVLAGIVLVPEGRLVFPDLSVHENLRLGAVNRRARAGWRGALEEVHAIFPKLLERRHQAAATLSGGEQQMLAIGRAPSPADAHEPSLGRPPDRPPDFRCHPHSQPP
jgi:branched-chain amino acid transport system ATP-binding protein